MPSLSHGFAKALVLIAALSAMTRMPSVSQTAPVTIRLAGDEWFLDSLTKTGLIPAYEQQSGVQVVVLHQNDQQIMATLDRAPSAPEDDLDVIVVRHRWLGTLVQRGQVQPIDGFLADPNLHDPAFRPAQQLFPEWWRELSSYGQRVYGFPYTALTTFLCYRKDLIADPEHQHKFRAQYHRELKPPETWQEYLELAEFFNHPQENFYGTDIQGKQGLALWYEWLSFIYSFGGDILNTHHGWEYGDIVLNSPQNVAATTLYTKAIVFSPPDTLKYGWNEAQTAVQQGHVFMGVLWNDQAPFLEDPRISKVAGKIGYIQLPSGGPESFSHMDGLTYLITARSKHPREAYRFLEWLMSARVQIQQTLSGSASIRASTYEDGQVRALPFTATFLASIPEARHKPTIPESPQITQASERQLYRIVSGQCSPQSGLDELALDVQKILGGNSRLRYPVKGAHQLGKSTPTKRSDAP